MAGRLHRIVGLQYCSLKRRLLSYNAVSGPIRVIVSCFLGLF